jgi:FtsH-binding integral membrane protein
LKLARVRAIFTFVRNRILQVFRERELEMANWNDPQPRTGFGASPSLDGRTAGRTTYDAGLRQHMLSIYNYMASGVLLSGIVAFVFANYGFAAAMMGSPIKWLVMLAPLGFVFAISGGAQRFSESTLKVLYWGFAAVMGMSLSTIFLIYTSSRGSASTATPRRRTCRASARSSSWVWSAS